MNITFKLFATLTDYLPVTARRSNIVMLDVAPDATISEIIAPFGLPPKVGEIWLHSLNNTGGYFANAPLPVELTYQMGHSANYGHVWISGDLDYFYLTGDRRARDVALLTADMMASAMTAKLGTHIRTLGWPTILVLAASSDRRHQISGPTQTGRR